MSHHETEQIMELSITTDDGLVTFGVEYDRYDGERHVFNWSIEEVVCEEGPKFGASRVVATSNGTGDGVRSGCRSIDDVPKLPEMLSTFLGFFSAFAEAIAYGDDSENGDLFPATCVEIAENYGDQIGYMGELLV